jgi:hypothetical protein
MVHKLLILAILYSIGAGVEHGDSIGLAGTEEVEAMKIDKQGIYKGSCAKEHLFREQVEAERTHNASVIECEGTVQIQEEPNGLLDPTRKQQPSLRPYWFDLGNYSYFLLIVVTSFTLKFYMNWRRSEKFLAEEQRERREAGRESTQTFAKLVKEYFRAKFVCSQIEEKAKVGTQLLSDEVEARKGEITLLKNAVTKLNQDNSLRSEGCETLTTEVANNTLHLKKESDIREKLERDNQAISLELDEVTGELHDLREQLNQSEAKRKAEIQVREGAQIEKDTLMLRLQKESTEKKTLLKENKKLVEGMKKDKLEKIDANLRGYQPNRGIETNLDNLEIEIANEITFALQREFTEPEVPKEEESFNTKLANEEEKMELEKLSDQLPFTLAELPPPGLQVTDERISPEFEDRFLREEKEEKQTLESALAQLSIFHNLCCQPQNFESFGLLEQNTAELERTIKQLSMTIENLNNKCKLQSTKFVMTAIKDALHKEMLEDKRREIHTLQTGNKLGPKPPGTDALRRLQVVEKLLQSSDFTEDEREILKMEQSSEKHKLEVRQKRNSLNKQASGSKVASWVPKTEPPKPLTSTPTSTPTNTLFSPPSTFTTLTTTPTLTALLRQPPPNPVRTPHPLSSPFTTKHTTTLQLPFLLKVPTEVGSGSPTIPSKSKRA